ncbi:TlpA disulfide reductase family protein [Alteribacter populi]|uniref:TlpA disulfide reductase family protein n=1 Tax=Alteribacter populi TaxID=2011011 RepID=UPI000BBA89A4|nr:TlpA disulfide reductase family protein [Alteribacter populi]
MKAPEFTLINPMTNETVSLTDFDNKAVLITFWVSWCPDSKLDLPNKEQLYKAMKTNELDMVMVNVVGREGTQEAGIDYYQEQGFTFPMLIDEKTKTYDAYHCMSVPTTFLLNKQHEIAGRFNDKASFQEILTSIGKVLEQ